MKFSSTRGATSVDSLSAILRGLAPDGGLYVPEQLPQLSPTAIAGCANLADAERLALGTIFDDVDNDVREAAIANLLAKFPAADPIPLVEADGFHILELFQGPTGAFKDVALSVLPVLMVAAAKGRGSAGGSAAKAAHSDNEEVTAESLAAHSDIGAVENIRKVLILTATSGDTGSAAMAGFAEVPGIEIAVFFPNTGTSRIQRLQMTTPAAQNVHGIAIRGNFDDAQAAVKRIFADPSIREAAAAKGVWLSSANSINIGRLVPQIGYYLLAAAKLGQSTPATSQSTLSCADRQVSPSSEDRQVTPSSEDRQVTPSSEDRQVTPSSGDGQAAPSSEDRQVTPSSEDRQVTPSSEDRQVSPSSDGQAAPGQYDVVVPSGNFGNLLAAYYAKLLGAPIRKFICASNINNVLTRFIQTGIYDPGEKFTVTNSPSMDIRKSSNVERLLWLLNNQNLGRGSGAPEPEAKLDQNLGRGSGAPEPEVKLDQNLGRGSGAPEPPSFETARLMADFAATGRYELNAAAKARLAAEFEAAFATPEETEAEMRLMRERCGYVLDPHTAVATAVARKLGYPRDGVPCVVAATATPYKFPETCLRAFGAEVLDNPPAAFAELETAPITQKLVVDINGIDAAVKNLF